MFLPGRLELVREGLRAVGGDVGDDPARVKHTSPRATKDVAQLALWHGRLDDHQKVVKHHCGRSRRRPRRAEGARARARGRGRWRSLRGTGTCGRRRSASALERFRRRGATRGETLRHAVPGEAVEVVRRTCSVADARVFVCPGAPDLNSGHSETRAGERPARLTTRAPCPSCRTTALPSSVRLPPRARLLSRLPGPDPRVATDLGPDRVCPPVRSFVGFLGLMPPRQPRRPPSPKAPPRSFGHPSPSRDD